MHITSVAIQTANILGIFTDPFEFQGDYGTEVNPVRNKVFELIVSRESLAKNYTNAEVKELMHVEIASEEEINDYQQALIVQARNEVKEYGPTLSQMITPELIEEIKKKHELFVESDLQPILGFIERYKDQKVFRFLRNNPPELTSLDKILRDKAAREGKSFDLPILGSTKLLTGKNSFELKKNLLEALFTKEIFDSTKTQQSILQALTKLKPGYLSEFLSPDADNNDLAAFSSPLGQVFFFWMSQSLNLNLIAIDPDMISQVNKVKEVFAHTLGDPNARAITLKEKLISANISVLFTQESDALVPDILINDGMYLPIDGQNMQDGTIVLLRSDMWESDYKIIPIEGYEGYTEGRMSVVLATQKGSGQQFLLASCHGHSTKAEDGRLQIRLIMDKFKELSNGNLQLFIGTDANTKSEEDVRLFRQQLDELSLTAPSVGPTTVKKRMVTAQNAKAGKAAIDEEDYLITLKPEAGGKLGFNQVTVGFQEGKADIKISLPNMDNQSDHYPVGAVMRPF